MSRIWQIFARRWAWIQRTIVTACAAGLAWLVGDAVLLNGGVVAAITAALSVRISLNKSLREGLGQILGTAIGASIALLSTKYFGFGTVTVIITVLLSAVVARLMHLGEVASINVPVTAIIVIGPGWSQTTATNRMTSTLIGAGIAIVLSYFAHPKTPAGRTIDQIAKIGEEAADLLAEMASGVRRGYDQNEAGKWLARARLLVEKLPAIRAQALEAKSYAKWFPTAEKDEAEDLYARGIAAEHTVVQIRQIARTLFDSASDEIIENSSRQIAQALSSASYAITARFELLPEENTDHIKDVIADEVRSAGAALVDEIIDSADDSNSDEIARSISLAANLEIIADSIDESASALTDVAHPTLANNDKILDVRPAKKIRKFFKKYF